MPAIAKPAITGGLMLSQADLIKRLDPQGNLADIAEVLNETNEVVSDVVFKEGNLPTGDQQTVRIGLPEVYWRQLGRGVPISKSEVAHVTETCAMMSAQSRLDVETAKLNGLTAQFRASEEKPFIEAMGQAFAKELFYGDRKNAQEGFSGLAVRYSSLNTAVDKSAKNVINCGATASSKKRSSIYIVGWGDNIYCPYPKGSTVGLESKDLGEQLVDDEYGNKYLAYVNMYNWNVGLMVRDWRYAVRLCNIDVDQLIAGKGIGAGDIQQADTMNLILQLKMALTKIPKTGKANVAIYMNSDVFNGLNILAERMNSPVIKYDTKSNEFGVQNAWTSFMGVPLKQCDEISNTETLVK